MPPVEPIIHLPAKVVPWNPAKILNSRRVNDMPAITEWAYRRALDVFYLEGSLPADPGLLANKIGKGCTLQTAEEVKKMFIPDTRYVGVLTHDFIYSYSEDLTEDNIRPDPEEEKKIRYFLLFKQKMLQSLSFIESCIGLRRISEADFVKILDEFFFKKIISEEYKRYQSAQSEKDLRIYVMNFIVHSEHYKTIHNATGQITGQQSATGYKFFPTGLDFSSPGS